VFKGGCNFFLRTRAVMMRGGKASVKRVFNLLACMFGGSNILVARDEAHELRCKTQRGWVDIVRHVVSRCILPFQKPFVEC
jgi:hypothetical protein